MSMRHTAKALDEGFPLFINPMIDIEQKGPYIDASVLLTLPVVSDQNAFCTIEYLAPIKFNLSNTCYTGPVTQDNLVILTCPNAQHILTTASLHKCYQDSSAFICPTNVLNLATNITWLGFPFNPDTKLTFPRNHVPAPDCTNLHPLLHLGGRLYLSTTSQSIQLSTGLLVTAPLAVYRIPCNNTLTGMTSGLGACPARITVTIPMASPYLLQFTPWAPVFANDSLVFRHTTLDIPPPAHLNKSVLRDLDTTFSTIDGQLSDAIHTTNQEIDHIRDSSFPTTAVSIAYTALGLGIANLFIYFLSFYCTHKRNGSNRCAHCQRPRQEIVDPPTGDAVSPQNV